MFTLTCIYQWRVKFDGSSFSSRPGLRASSGLFVQYQIQAHRNTLVVDTIPAYHNQNELTFDEGSRSRSHTAPVTNLRNSPHNNNFSQPLIDNYIVANESISSASQAHLTVEPVQLSAEARLFLDESRRVRVAVGGGLTSSQGNGSYVIVTYMRMVMPLFRYLLPTFCRTATPGYDYHFYFAYDHNDPLFLPPSSPGSVDGMGEFVRTFDELASIHCRGVGKPTLHMIRCQHQRHPAWAQNDAMMQAYLDGMDFFYRYISQYYNTILCRPYLI